jgi:hypothetical protein
MNLIRHLHAARSLGRLPAPLLLPPVPKPRSGARRHRMQAEGQKNFPKHS